MKRVFWVGFLLLMVLPFSSALLITEVMPDCGNLSANCEFIELFSSQSVDLRGYTLDTQGQKIVLNVSIEGYFVLTKNSEAFSKRFGSAAFEWRGMGLANSGDKIQLFDPQDKVVDSFSYPKANKNLSWQLMGSWQECLPSPGKANQCSSGKEVENNKAESPPHPVQEIKKPEQQQAMVQQEKVEEFPAKNTSQPARETSLKAEPLIENLTQKHENITSDTLNPSIIRLQGKDIKTAYTSRNERIKEYAIYGFALFCVLFIILLIIKRN